MKVMLWHGGGGLDAYLDTDDFIELSNAVIRAKFKNNPFISSINKLFPNFSVEQLRVYSYYSGLGQFWRVMADIFLELSNLYELGEIKSIPQVIEHIKSGLVTNARKPVTYSVKINGKAYDLLPSVAGLTFLPDLAIPYVEAIFFRGTPFQGTVSYNAQAYQIPADQARFEYGALYADPLPIGGAGIPPTLLMQDMSHYIPNYLHEFYRRTRRREEDDLLVQICMTFQKSMFCVTSAAIIGLMPYASETVNPIEQKENHAHLEMWVGRLRTSRLLDVNLIV